MTTQAAFTFDVVPARCWHQTTWIVVGDPRDLGDCVNESLACSHCGAIVGERSLTRAAWLARKPGR